MSKVAELERRIKAKLDEMEDNAEARERARARIHRVNLRVPEIREELIAVRGRLRQDRVALAAVVDELEAHDAESPDVDTPDEIRLRQRRDRFAGEIELDTATRDRLLLRLDKLRDLRADAREVLADVIEESEEDREALERMRARYRDAIEARKRNDRPSPNFDWAEFYCNDGTPIPEESKPAIRHWCQTVGEPARAKYGPVDINSGFRHRAYNARVGGEDASVHIYDYPGRDFKAVAVDFTCERGTPSEWFAFTAGKADGRGLYRTFHHADNRNRIGWPDATWSG